MSPTEYNSSSPCWCTDVSMEQLRCRWWKVAHKQPTSSVINTCSPPVLLPAALTLLCPSVVRHRIYYNTDPCLCLEPRGLLLQCSLLIGSPRSVTDKLQRVLNAAARVITNTNYESGLSRILHHDLHWLDVTERIQFWVAATVYQCLNGMASAYLTELCTPASASRRGGLRSVTTSNHAADCQPTAPVRSVSLVQYAGMPYRII